MTERAFTHLGGQKSRSTKDTKNHDGHEGNDDCRPRSKTPLCSLWFIVSFVLLHSRTRNWAINLPVITPGSLRFPCAPAPLRWLDCSPSSAQNANFKPALLRAVLENGLNFRYIQRPLAIIAAGDRKVKEMKAYKEFQIGWIIFIILIPIQLFLTYLYFMGLGDRPLEKNTFLIGNGIFLLIYLLFYGMTIKIDVEEIKISYGFGLIRKTIKLSKIENISIVKNPWYYGWGIRLIPNGWLFNISGSNGLELEFKDKKGIIRIGTKDSAKLKNEIRKRMTE